MGGYSVEEGAWRNAPSVAIKCELPSPLHHIPDRQKNLIERIAKLRKEAKKDWVNLGTRGRESSGNGRALREPGAPLTKRLHIVANDGCNGDPYALAVKWWDRFIKEAQNAGCDFGDWEPPLFYRTDPDGVETEILLPRPRRLADNEDGDKARTTRLIVGVDIQYLAARAPKRPWVQPRSGQPSIGATAWRHSPRQFPSASSLALR